MIKINLLPQLPRSLPQHFSRERIQLIIGISMLGLSLIICLIWAIALIQERDMLLTEKITKNQELLIMAESNLKKESLKKSQDVLLTQAYSRRVHDDDSSVPIMVLDEVSKSLEPLALWLMALSIERHDVSIEGFALSRRDIAKFIGNLEGSSMFGQLIRMESHSHHINGEDVQRFTLQFTAES